MPATVGDMASLETLQQRLELLSAEARRAGRAARVMTQLAAQARDELRDLQSKEDTRQNDRDHHST